MSEAPKFHESFARDESIALPDERHFARVMGIASVCFSLLVWWLHGEWTFKSSILVIIAFFFFITGLVKPILLRPLNTGWMKLGFLLHKITNPVLMVLIYSIAIVPLGLLLKLFGKDPLKRRIDPAAESYWVNRTNTIPPEESMRQQF